MVLTFNPLAAPSSTVKLGVFGEDCLRVENPSSAAAQFCEAAQEISGTGSPSFWILLLGEARKSISPVAHTILQVL
jgi:hypothetical protein